MSTAIEARFTTTALAICVSLGCSDVQPSAVAPSTVPAVQRYLASGGEELLDRDGLFKESALSALQPQDEISAGRARDLGTAFIRTHGDGLNGVMERDHGGPIRISALLPCGRAYYAETPYQQLAVEIPRMYHRQLGSWWLVTMCGEGGVRQISLAVPALATDLQITSEGRLRYPEFSGGTFILALGIPKHLGELPQEPERAVATLAELSSGQVAGAPRLIAPPMRSAAVYQYPQMARWQVSFVGAAAMMTVDEAGNRVQRVATAAFQGCSISTIHHYFRLRLQRSQVTPSFAGLSCDQRHLHSWADCSGSQIFPLSSKTS